MSSTCVLVVSKTSTDGPAAGGRLIINDNKNYNEHWLWSTVQLYPIMTTIIVNEIISATGYQNSTTVLLYA